MDSKWDPFQKFFYMACPETWSCYLIHSDMDAKWSRVLFHKSVWQGGGNGNAEVWASNAEV